MEENIALVLQRLTANMNRRRRKAILRSIGPVLQQMERELATALGIVCKRLQIDPAVTLCSEAVIPGNNVPTWYVIHAGERVGQIEQLLTIEGDGLRFVTSFKPFR